MLEWVLLRLQAFSKLFVRMLNLGKSAGPLIYGKLCLGWSIKTTFVTFGLISRLLALSKFFVIKSIEWYDSLHEYLPYFKSTTDFLRGHEFPAHLKQWIGDVDLSPPAKKTTVDEVFEIFNLVAPNKEDDCDDVDIIRSTFFKTAKEITTDSDVKEVEVKKMRSVKSEEEEKNKASYVPDLGSE